MDYPYSDTMLDKVNDITGYLCGARLHSMIHLNRLKSEYRYVFTEYYKMFCSLFAGTITHFRSTASTACGDVSQSKVWQTLYRF